MCDSYLITVYCYRPLQYICDSTYVDIFIKFSKLITQRRSVAKSVGCFQRRLFDCVFDCVFVNMITSNE